MSVAFSAAVEAYNKLLLLHVLQETYVSLVLLARNVLRLTSSRFSISVAILSLIHLEEQS